MTRETKIALFVGLSIILLIGIIVSDHLSVVNEQEPADVAGLSEGTENQLSSVSGGGNGEGGEGRESGEASSTRTTPVPLPEETPGGPDGEAEPSEVLPAGPDTRRALPLQVDGPRSADNQRPRLSDAMMHALDRRRAGRGQEDQAGQASRDPGDGGVADGSSGDFFFYEVKPNETLWDIAEKHLDHGRYWNRIMAANPETVGAEGSVRHGVRLKIPAKSSLSTPTVARGDSSGDGSDSGPARTVRMEPGSATIMLGRPEQAGSEDGSSGGEGDADSVSDDVTARSATGGEYEREAGVTVQPGDTLAKLAARHLGSGGRWHKLYQANRDVLDSPDELQPGMTLRLPNDAVSRAILSGDQETYTVKPGDTLSEISQAVYGTKEHWKRLLEANEETLGGSAVRLRAGQTLIVPELGS